MIAATNTRQLIGTSDSDNGKERCCWAYAIETLVDCWGEAIEVTTDTLRGLRAEMERLEWLTAVLQRLEHNFEDAKIEWACDAQPVPSFWEGQVLSEEDLKLQVEIGVGTDLRIHQATLAVYRRAAERIAALLGEVE